MPWLQLKIQTEKPHVEEISNWLSENGALSVTYQDAADQPLFEPPPGETPLWLLVTITGLYDMDIDSDHVTSMLEQQFKTKISSCKSELLEDKDWVRSWMDDFKPMDFGNDLWIIPSHHDAPSDSATNIVLDPGLAFGTGTHPTTAMCLRWLAANPPSDKTVIDYGCGSGILAIAAAKLGAISVLAIDNDPQALTATDDNAQRNKIERIITTQHSDKDIEQRCDLIIANILAGPLTSLVSRFSDILTTDVTKETQIILSGLLVTQSDELIESYKPYFKLELSATDGDWGLLTGKRI